RPNDLTTPIDPTTLVNFRTPRFDLDSVYGNGPSLSPQLYAADGVHLKLGAPLTGSATDAGSVDLPRDPTTGQAFLGDPRNDENRLVGQMHTIFLRFHNMVADRVKAAHPTWTPTQVFNEAQRQVQLHYQWAVVTDFLPTMVGQSMVTSVLPSIDVQAMPPN